MERRSFLGRNRGRAALVGVLLVAAVLGMRSRGGEDEFTGGCDRFRVYAQNTFQPFGAAVREEPDVLSARIEPGFAANEVIAVNGWVETGEPPYPTNSPPWDSDRWFRLANREGWVSFAGVRAVPTDPETNLDGGEPAPTLAECEGAYHAG